MHMTDGDSLKTGLTPPKSFGSAAPSFVSASGGADSSGDEAPSDLIGKRSIDGARYDRALNPFEDEFDVDRARASTGDALSASVTGLLAVRKAKETSPGMAEPLLDIEQSGMSITGERFRSVRYDCFISALRVRPSSSQLCNLTIFLMMLSMTFCGVLPHEKHIENNNAGYFTAALVAHICIWGLQMCIFVQLAVIVKERLWSLTIRHVCEMYLATLFTFTGLYVLSWFYYRMIPSRAFYFPDDDETSEETLQTNNRFEIFVALFYFSASQQTLCGVASIIPSSYLVQCVAALQMLIGLFFAIFIISFTLTRLGRDVSQRQKLMDHVENDSYLVSERARMFDYRGTFAQHDMSTGSRLKRARDWTPIRAIRRFTRRYLLFTVIFIQLAKAGWEYYIDKDILSFGTGHDKIPPYVVAIAVAIDVINIGLVISTSLKFIHLGHMTEITAYNLIQCYLACVIIFMGCYADLQLFNRDSKAFTLSTNSHSHKDGETIRDNNFWSMLFHFGYFSFAVMTLNGNGLNIEPHKWYACAIVVLEMLLGVFFHVVVFGLGLLKIANARLKAQASKRRRIGGVKPDTELVLTSLL
jgi:hypothetical protein